MHWINTAVSFKICPHVSTLLLVKVFVEEPPRDADDVLLTAAEHDHAVEQQEQPVSLDLQEANVDEPQATQAELNLQLQPEQEAKAEEIVASAVMESETSQQLEEEKSVSGSRGCAVHI